MSKRFLAVPLAAALVAGCQKSPTPSPPVPEAKVPVAAAPPAPAPAVVPRAEAQRRTGRHPGAAPLGSSGPGPRRARRDARGDGDTAGALVEARRALADDGENVDALSLIARLARASGQATLAAEAYERLDVSTPRTRCQWCRRRGCGRSRGTSRPPRAASRHPRGPGRGERRGLAGTGAGPARPPGTSRARSRASSRRAPSSPRTDGCSTTSASPISGPAAIRRRWRCSSAPPSCSPRRPWCTTTSASPASGPVIRWRAGGLRPLGAARPEVRQGPGQRRAHRDAPLGSRCRGRGHARTRGRRRRGVASPATPTAVRRPRRALELRTAAVPALRAGAAPREAAPRAGDCRCFAGCSSSSVRSCSRASGRWSASSSGSAGAFRRWRRS